VIRNTALLTIVLVAGCGGYAAPPVGTAGTQVTTAQSRSVVPNACDQQVDVNFDGGGGTFDVPICFGWKGKIAYPPTKGKESYSLTVEASIKRNFGVPAPPSGKAIFYMQMANIGSASHTFEDTGAIDTFHEIVVQSTHKYALWVYNLSTDNQCRKAPPSGCPPWFAIIGSPPLGEHTLTFESPLNGATIGSYSAPVWQLIDLGKN
jgi:hypothetical protein